MRSRLRRALQTAALGASAGLAVGCGASAHPRATDRTATARSQGITSTAAQSAAKPPAKPPPKPPAMPPQVLPAALSTRPTALAPAVRWHGRTAAWLARLPSGTTTLIFDQSLLELHLHSGTLDAGGSGWRFGPAVRGFELGHLVAGFNGGFRLSTGAGGFASYGRVAVPLRYGLGSITTYSDGSTDIGTWHQEVPAPGKRIVSVRQNLEPLIDHGRPASTVECLSCWGATLGGVSDPARSALGITPDGKLVWVAGETLTVDDLVHTLLAAHVARAVELDINPEWVAGYLYEHRRHVVPVPALPDQQGIPGQFLVSWSRDFFAVTAR